MPALALAGGLDYIHIRTSKEVANTLHGKVVSFEQ